MNSCAEFLINDPRFGEPVWTKSMPRKAIEVSIAMLQPIRDAMVRRGLVVGEVTGGKPWGSGCDVDSGKSRVSVFFYPVPSLEKSRWEGSIHVISAPPLWRRLPGLRDRVAEEQAIESVAGELREVLKDFPSLTDICWMTLQQHCSSRGFRDRREKA